MPWHRITNHYAAISIQCNTVQSEHVGKGLCSIMTREQVAPVLFPTFLRVHEAVFKNKGQSTADCVLLEGALAGGDQAAHAFVGYLLRHCRTQSVHENAGRRRAVLCEVRRARPAKVWLKCHSFHRKWI